MGKKISEVRGFIPKSIAIGSHIEVVQKKKKSILPSLSHETCPTFKKQFEFTIFPEEVLSCLSVFNKSFFLKFSLHREY